MNFFNILSIVLSILGLVLIILGIFFRDSQSMIIQGCIVLAIAMGILYFRKKK